MRTFIIFIAVILSAGALQAQNNHKSNSTVYVSRIDFNEKQNTFLKSVPAQLIYAYGTNKLKGYAPGDPAIPVNFVEFLINAGFSLPPSLSEGMKNCSENLSLDPYLLETLSCYMDVYEEEYFDIKSSMQVRKVTYVTLIFPGKYDYRGIDTPAITFSVPQMNTLPVAKYSVVSPQNDAITHSMQEIFIMKLFSGTVIQKQNIFFTKPASDDKKDQPRQIQNYEYKNE